MSENNSMKDLYESCFAVIETNLFLDTHPCCEDALHYYEMAAEKEKKNKKAYIDKYGPLVMTDASASCYHDWVKGPWPWEGGNC